MASGIVLKVLLVEDNEDIREGLVALLESEGYTVLSTGSAEDGLALLRAESFDLIITDYMLPGQSGGWLLEQATLEGQLRGARAMIITAHPRVSAPMGVRLLHKPLDIDDFLRAVCEVLTPVYALPR